MDAHIHHRSSRPHVLGPDELRTACCHHEDVGFAGVGRQIGRAGVGDGDGGVGGLKHQGHRLPHENAAADHHGALARRIDAIAAQHRHHPGGGAAARARLPLEQPSEIEGVQTIGILFRINGHQQRPLIEASRKRQLQEDPVHCRVGIQPFNRLKHLRWRRVAGEVITKAGHPDPSTGFFLVGDVNGAGGIITNPQHRQARRSPRLGQTPFDQGLKTMLHIPCQHLAVQTQGHGIPMHSLQHAL